MLLKESTTNSEKELFDLIESLLGKDNERELEVLKLDPAVYLVMCRQGFEFEIRKSKNDAQKSLPAFSYKFRVLGSVREDFGLSHALMIAQTAKQYSLTVNS